jgi:hypothetical protein
MAAPTRQEVLTQVRAVLDRVQDDTRMLSELAPMVWNFEFRLPINRSIGRNIQELVDSQFTVERLGNFRSIITSMGLNIRTVVLMEDWTEEVRSLNVAHIMTAFMVKYSIPAETPAALRRLITLQVEDARRSAAADTEAPPPPAPTFAHDGEHTMPPSQGAATRAQMERVMEKVNFALNSEFNGIVGNSNTTDVIDRMIFVAVAVAPVSSVVNLVMSIMQNDNEEYPRTVDGETRRLSEAIPDLKFIITNPVGALKDKLLMIRCTVDAFFLRYEITLPDPALLTPDRAQQWMRRTSNSVREQVHYALTNEAPITDRRRLHHIHRRRYNFARADMSDPASVAATAAAAAENHDAVFVMGPDGITQYMVNQPPVQADSLATAFAAAETPAPDHMDILATALDYAQSSIPAATPAPAQGFTAFVGVGLKLGDPEQDEAEKKKQEEAEKKKRQAAEDLKMLSELIEDCEIYEQIEFDAFMAALQEQTSSEDDDEEEDDDPQAIFPKIRKFPKRPK